MAPKIVRVLLSEERRGDGSQENPERTVAQIHTMDGVLIGEYDPLRLADSRMHPGGLRKLGFRLYEHSNQP